MATFLLWTAMAKAQQIGLNHVQSPLKGVLQDIESKTGVLFSFSEALIEGISLSIDENNISLADALALISERTGLVLERISQKQIIIRKATDGITYCAFLVDAITREPLVYATIVLDHSGRGTVTDESGFFSLDDLEPNTHLRVGHVGYSELLIPVSGPTGSNCPTLAMLPDTQSLDEVVVFAYLTKGVNKNADGSFTMVQEDMGLFPGMVEPDIFQSIQYAPGITSLDESASGIQIRGGSPDQNLILFDGIKLYNTGHFFGMISSLNPQVIESAKIFKGGASPRYGDRVSGVIDISSGERVPERAKGGFGINGTHGNAFIKAPLGKHIGIVLSGRRSHTDILRTPTFDALSEKVFQNTKFVADPDGGFPGWDDDDDDDDDIEEFIGRDEFRFHDTNAKIIVAPSPKDLITLSGLYTENELDFSVSDDEDVLSDRYHITNKGAGLDWNGGFGELWEYGFGGYFSGFDSQYENTLSEDGEVEERTLRHNSVEDIGADVHIGYRLNVKNKILLGYQYSRTDVNFRLFYDDEVGEDDPDEDSRNYDVEREGVNRIQTLYAEYTHSFPNKGFLSLGARASHYSTVNDQFVEPRANLEFPIGRGLRLKGSFEKRYQPISQLVEFEDIQLRLENNIWTLSNGSEIPILESTQYSGGLLLDSGGWTLDIDGYHKNMNGLTSFTNGFITSPTKLSAGESTITGVDVLLRRKWEQYNLWIGYTFNDVTYEFPELQPGSFPGNNDIAHNLELANSYTDGNWQFSLGWNFRSGSPYTPVSSFDSSGQVIDFGSINSERLPNYHRLDASVLYGFGISQGGLRGELGASVNNIYARKVPISIFYRQDTNINTGEVELNQVRQMSQGITPNLVLRFHF